MKKSHKFFSSEVRFCRYFPTIFRMVNAEAKGKQGKVRRVAKMSF